MSTAVLNLGDGISGLRSLPEGSVDAVVSDLPAGVTRASFDKAPDLEALNSAIWHALKPDGVAVLMAASLPFAAQAIRSIDGYRYDLVWRKSLATGFFLAKQRPLRAHEFILVFAKSRSYFSPQMSSGHEPIHANAGQGSHGRNYGRQGQPSKARAGATTRYPTSVLEFASVGTTSQERQHSQQKPVDLMVWLVRSFTSPGELVADPFAGSASTGVAALTEGRCFIGWERDPIHCTAARERINAEQAAK